MDNIFTERFRRSLKYEEVYLKDYQAVREARQGIGDYFHLYNTRTRLSDTGRGILWKEELMTIMYVIVYRTVT